MEKVEAQHIRQAADGLDEVISRARAKLGSEEVKGMQQ